MNPLFPLTHRLVFSTFSSEELKKKTENLENVGIKPLVKSHNANPQTGTLGQLPEYQISYDLYVPNSDFEEAAHLLG